MMDARTAPPRFSITSRHEAQRVGYTVATVGLVLPLGFHALTPPQRLEQIERALSHACDVAADSLTD